MCEVGDLEDVTFTRQLATNEAGALRLLSDIVPRPTRILSNIFLLDFGEGGMLLTLPRLIATQRE